MMGCPKCGLDTYWQGGIKPSVCVLDQHPMCHAKAAKARRVGQLEGRWWAQTWKRAAKAYRARAYSSWLGAMVAEDRRDELVEEVRALPCYVARNGEMTYECRHDNLCEACALRNKVGG